jgi:hypothetical protein
MLGYSESTEVKQKLQQFAKAVSFEGVGFQTWREVYESFKADVKELEKFNCMPFDKHNIRWLESHIKNETLYYYRVSVFNKSWM